MLETLMTDLKRRMDSALEALHKELAGLRTGRASASLLEPIKVDVYGSLMPISQLGTVSAPEPRLLVVNVWDKEVTKIIEKAIRDANLGLNPMAEGQTIRVPLPDLNEQRRQELAKVAAKYAEHARVAVRNVRRDGMESLKKLEKDKQISEDQHHKFSQDIQVLTDNHIKQIDTYLATKEKEIMHV